MILAKFSDLFREAAWQFKTRLSRSAPVTTKRGTPNLKALLDTLTPAQKARVDTLLAAYTLNDWPRLCKPIELRENLYVLDLFDQHLPMAPRAGLGLDIGCRGFSHLPALSAFRPLQWHGVELDADARFISGVTRRGYGEWMAAQRPGSRFIGGSLLEVEGSYSMIWWSLPFVLPGSLHYWGLPQRFFQPKVLLEYAWHILAPGGTMMIVNQGPVEDSVQAGLFQLLGIPAQSLGQLESVLSPFKRQRFGWLVHKPPVSAPEPR